MWRPDTKTATDSLDKAVQARAERLPAAVQARAERLDEAVQARAERLDEAKRRAAASFARTMRGDCKTAIEGWAADAQAVLRARIDLLNALMLEGPAARLCLDADRPPRVCVMYNRMRCEGEAELGPMQSTMAWAVRGAEGPVQHLMSAGELAQAGPVQELLGLIRASMPRKKDVLQPLAAVLGLPPPERLVLKSVAGLNAQQPGHTRVMEGLGEQKTGTGLAPLYQVVWGALDVSAHEAWQNPSTNAAIRLSILETAHQLARDAAASKDAPWSTVAHLQLRILHGDEAHVLSLTPFVDSESCTVTHLQFAQSVFDAHGPERGILNLAQDPAAIHAIPGGKALPLQAYVCVGAHRKARLSEAQLNYVHARGLLAHGFDTRHLPRPGQLRFDLPMPAAKSTRVSAAGLDVLASSYHVADQVYTTVSVVQYPPFGTQFEQAGQGVLLQPGTAGKTKGVLRDLKAFSGPFLGDSDDEMPDAPESGEDDDDIILEPQHVVFKPKREPLREDETPSFLIPHEFLPNMDAMGKPRARKNNWKIALRHGEHYFVDGIIGDPTDLRNRFIWFELDDGDRYKEAQQAYFELKNYIREQHIAWNNVESFYWNIYHNKNVGRDGYTAGQIWQHYWSMFISKHAMQNLQSFVQGHKLKSFWYVADTQHWKHILPADQIVHGHDNWEYYAELQSAYMHKMRSSFLIPDDPIIRSKRRLSRQAICPEGQIPLPAHLRRGQAQPPQQDLAGLQARVGALEAQLRRQRQDDNTSCLLERVLERLELAD